jgi:prepilin-type N-terminal cleavage/methylation domain-containing protein
MKTLDRQRARSGFTLLEVAISIVIIGLVLANVHLVSRTGTTAVRSGALRSSLENELELTLDRITFALMGAQDSEIEGPVPAPMPSSFVRFASVIGRDGDGNVVMSSTEQISWSAHEDGGEGEAFMEGGHVTWVEDADAEAARRITWSNSVPTVYMDEAPGNAEDDNGNDLLDEQGLAFARDGAQIQVFLTVERIDDNGDRQPVERSLRIAPRN